MQEERSLVLPPLLMKPARNSNELLYSYFETELQARISFRSMNLERDTDMIYRWVNEPYAKTFWQLNGSRELVHSTYAMILHNARAHSFIALLDEKPIAQIDVYGIKGDEVGEHIDDPNEYNCGMHLLMLPPKEMEKGWSYYTLRNFQRWYFMFAPHDSLFAEPDQKNIPANKLAMDAGFHFLKTIHLSSKTANLYAISRQQFKK